MGVWSGRVLPFPASYIWSFSIPQSMSFRRSLRRLAVVLAFGASSIFWKAAAMIIRAQMLMCHKVTHKNLIDSSPLFRYCLTHASCNFFVKTIDSDTSKEI